MSTQDCRRTGIAEIDEFTITVNPLFLQVIEPIDQDGFSGNLSDILTTLTADNGRDEKLGPSSTLIPNAPIPALSPGAPGQNHTHPERHGRHP